MKKEILYDKNALKELLKFDKPVQQEFFALLEVLETEGQLEIPEAKKITKNLFEIRIQYSGQYRGLYAYIKNNKIVILHCFKKKTQRIPLKDIKIAKQRLQQYA